jgi:hypothetical protein
MEEGDRNLQRRIVGVPNDLVNRLRDVVSEIQQTEVVWVLRCFLRYWGVF